jgi:hypothetical protein
MKNKVGCKNDEKIINKRQRIPKRQSDMNHPEKLATGNQDEDKNKTNTQCNMC